MDRAACSVLSSLETASDRRRVSRDRVRRSSLFGGLDILAGCGLSLGEPVGVDVLRM